MNASVSIVLWRFCLDGHAASPAEAFSGDGAAGGAGRWNHEGRRVVYCATSQAVALLEVLVDLPQGDVPQLSLFRAEVPDGLASESVAAHALPKSWRATPPPRELRDLGARWLDARRSVMLVVPSAIVPEETNVLLSPDHDDFERIAIAGPFAFDLDPRLLRR